MVGILELVFGLSLIGPLTGLIPYISIVLGGLILLGFAQVIQNTSLTAQRLHRIELLLENATKSISPARNKS